MLSKKQITERMKFGDQVLSVIKQAQLISWILINYSIEGGAKCQG